VNNELVVHTENKLLETLILAENIFNHSFKIPEIDWSLKGRKAGQAWHSKNKIRLNYKLALENLNDFVNQVVPHEVAHLIVKEIYGYSTKPHGREWQATMKKLGLRPERCHSFDTKNTIVKIHKKFIYKCSCGTHKVGKKVHRNLQSGAEYKCSSCKMRIIYRIILI